jgi:predicted nucleotidyltransferase component of viral defense system
MYPETLYPKTKQVLELLSAEKFLSDFYLAGGTALALQIGHRKSIDLDFFSSSFPDEITLLNALEKFNPTILNQAPKTLDILINETKVSFLQYNYPLLEKFGNHTGVNMASVIDIACMKITAISSRGSKKDFIDLYEILKTNSLEKIFLNFEKKYKNVKYQKTHLLKSLLFFNDAENDPDPDYMLAQSWDTIKLSLEKAVKQYLS